LTFFNVYDLRLLMIVFSVNKNYISFIFIFDFFRLTKKSVAMHELSTSIVKTDYFNDMYILD
jgi:hypothetical protein